MSILTTRAFWEAAAERSVKTFAQSTLVVLTSGTAVGLSGVDWGSAASVGGLAAVVSVLTSIASVGFGNDGPSVTTETLTGKHEAA